MAISSWFINNSLSLFRFYFHSKKLQVLEKIERILSWLKTNFKFHTWVSFYYDWIRIYVEYCAFLVISFYIFFQYRPKYLKSFKLTYKLIGKLLVKTTSLVVEFIINGWNPKSRASSERNTILFLFFILCKNSLCTANSVS